MEADNSLPSSMETILIQMKLVHKLLKIMWDLCCAKWDRTGSSSSTSSFPDIIFPPKPHMHISFIYLGDYIKLANGSVVI